MDSSELVNRITAGLSVEDALAAFVAACRHPDTLFITETWFAPRAERLRCGLDNPITADDAHVLRELVWQHVRFQDAFDWLDRKPITWNDYQAWKAAEAVRQTNRRMEEGIFPWEDAIASRADITLQANAIAESPRTREGICPRCKQPLSWVYFSSPPWTWEKLSGRAGWLGLCDAYRLQVDFELKVMN